MKITDLNIDFLEKIFKHLNLGDLLNVADSNKQLKKAADGVFSSKYGSRKVTILPHKNGGIYDRTYIYLYTWKGSYQLLRCFGNLISHLHIELPTNLCMQFTKYSHETFAKNFKHLFAYVTEYCDAYIQHLSIEDNSVQLCDFISAVHFKHVKSFEIIYNNSSSKKFPKIPFAFSHLEDLRVILCGSRFEHRIGAFEEFYTFLSRNPSVTKIWMNPNYYMSKLDISKLADMLPMLREVAIFRVQYTLDEVYSFEKHFPRLEKSQFILHKALAKGHSKRPKRRWQCENLLDRTRRRELLISFVKPK